VKTALNVEKKPVVNQDTAFISVSNTDIVEKSQEASNAFLKKWILEHVAHQSEEEEEEGESILEFAIKTCINIVSLEMSIAEEKKKGNSDETVRRMQNELEKLRRDWNMVRGHYDCDEKLVKKAVADFQKEEKKRREQERGQRKREERRKAAEEAKKRERETQAEGVDADDEDDGGMFGNMLQEPDPTTPIVRKRSHTVQNILREVCVPPKWTGKTPKTLLLEHCRKRDHHSRVVYHVPAGWSGPGYRANVSIQWSRDPAQHFNMENESCETQRDAEHYVSVGAHTHQLVFLFIVN
jgi:ATP-dependent RNA helicase DHX29